MTGGGSAIAPVPVARHDAVVRRIGTAFEGRGRPVPETFPAVPSAGAGRDD